MVATAYFRRQGRDRYNNKSAGGEINVYMAPHNMKPMDLTITDQGEGDYLVTYTAPPGKNFSLRRLIPLCVGLFLPSALVAVLENVPGMPSAIQGAVLRLPLKPRFL